MTFMMIRSLPIKKRHGMNTEPRKWRPAASILITIIYLFCAPGFLCPSALGEDGKKTKRLEKKAQSRQQRLEKRSMKKADANKPADAATQPDPKPGIEPVERKITSEQVSIAARKIDALVVANLKKHNQLLERPGDLGLPDQVLKERKSYALLEWDIC